MTADDPTTERPATACGPTTDRPAVTAGGRRLLWPAAAVLSIVLAATMTAVWATARFGSVRSAIRYANGETLTVDAKTKSFGVGTPNQRTEVVFKVTNLGTQPVRIVGGRSVCVCTVPDDLPMSLRPRQSMPFRVRIRVPTEVGGFANPLTLFTNDPNQPELELMIIGEVVAPAGGRNER